MKTLLKKLITSSLVAIVAFSSLGSLKVAAFAVQNDVQSGQMPTITQVDNLITTATTSQAVTLNGSVHADNSQGEYMLSSFPEGSMDFYANDQLVTCDSYSFTQSETAGTWSAECVTQFTTANTYVIHAKFTGGPATNASESDSASDPSIIITDSPADTTTNVSDDGYALQYDTTTFTANVEPSNEISQSGTVTFYDSYAHGEPTVITGCEDMTINESGVYACDTNQLGAGCHSITAVYSGVPGYYNSSAGNDDTSCFAVVSRPQITSAVAGDTQVSLAWNAPDVFQTGYWFPFFDFCPLSGYSVYVYQGDTLVKTLSAKDYDKSLSRVVTGLTNGTTYTFTVAAAYCEGEGYESLPAYATPAVPVVVPPAPTPAATPPSTTTTTTPTTPNTGTGSITGDDTETTDDTPATTTGSVLAASTSKPAAGKPKVAALANAHNGFPWWIILLILALIAAYYAWSRSRKETK